MEFVALLQGISESVARRLNPYNVKITHKPHSALRSNLVNVKDSVPTLQRCKVIYQIPCSGCDKTYTGQTGRLLKEHRGSVRRHDTNLCLALHYMDRGHTFNWQDTRILGSANSQRAREAIEALHSAKHSVNQFMQLDPCYRSMRLQH